MQSWINRRYFREWHNQSDRINSCNVIDWATKSEGKVGQRGRDFSVDVCLVIVAADWSIMNTSKPTRWSRVFAAGLNQSENKFPSFVRKQGSSKIWYRDCISACACTCSVLRRSFWSHLMKADSSWCNPAVNTRYVALFGTWQRLERKW